MSSILNPNISILSKTPRSHSKASEKYIIANFNYSDAQTFEYWIPIEYRRTGVHISSEAELIDYLNTIYEQLNPIKFSAWMTEQEIFWNTEKKNATTTKPFYDSLIQGGWQCVECTLPKNPNWARRIQDLKEFGYTIATNTNQYCEHCGANKTHLQIIPINRGGMCGNGYETISTELRKKLLNY